MLCLPEKGPALVRQADAVGPVVKQGEAALPFQIPDRSGQAGLGDRQLPGGSGQALVLAYGNVVLQLLKCHVPHLLSPILA